MKTNEASWKRKFHDVKPIEAKTGTFNHPPWEEKEPEGPEIHEEKDSRKRVR